MSWVESCWITTLLATSNQSFFHLVFPCIPCLIISFNNTVQGKPLLWRNFWLYFCLVWSLRWLRRAGQKQRILPENTSWLQLHSNYVTAASILGIQDIMYLCLCDWVLNGERLPLRRGIAICILVTWSALFAPVKLVLYCCDLISYLTFKRLQLHCWVLG